MNEAATYTWIEILRAFEQLGWDNDQHHSFALLMSTLEERRELSETP